MSRIRANTITNAAGTGAPTFPNGVNVVGVVTAATFEGNGSLLTGLVAGVGIKTAGGTVGTGATFLDFRGSGISTVTVGSGIATVNISGGGGGGFSAVGYIFNL